MKHIEPPFLVLLLFLAGGCEEVIIRGPCRQAGIRRRRRVMRDHPWSMRPPGCFPSRCTSRQGTCPHPGCVESGIPTDLRGTSLRRPTVRSLL